MISGGSSAPLGATACRGGVNFNVFSKQTTCVELLLFDGADDAQPTRVIPLDAGHIRAEAPPGPDRGQRSSGSGWAFEHPEFVPAGFAEVLEGVVGTIEHGLPHLLRRQVGSEVRSESVV